MEAQQWTLFTIAWLNAFHRREFLRSRLYFLVKRESQKAAMKSSNDILVTSSRKLPDLFIYARTRAARMWRNYFARVLGNTPPFSNFHAARKFCRSRNHRTLSPRSLKSKSVPWTRFVKIKRENHFMKIVLRKGRCYHRLDNCCQSVHRIAKVNFTAP